MLAASTNSPLQPPIVLGSRAVPKCDPQEEEFDEGELWDDEGDDATHASVGEPASYGAADAQDSLAAGVGSANGTAGHSPSSSSSDDDDLDLALDDAALQRRDSISRSLSAAGGDGDGGGFLAASTKLPGGGSAGGGTGALAAAAGDSKNYRFPARGSVPASLPISAGGSGRLLRAASEIPRLAQPSRLSTESKMGTSVPVAIPMAARMRMAQHEAASGAHDGMRAATFVPPHQLLAQMEGAPDQFSLGVSAGGVDVSASLKRDRLAQRNAILRRTGFIEGGGKPAFLETMDPIRESAIEPGSSLGKSSALSAALGTSPKIQRMTLG